MLWKKYRIPLLIELVMICLMLFLANLVYQLEKSRICDESRQSIEYMDGWIEDYLQGEEKTVDSLMHYFMDRISDVSPVNIFQGQKVQDLANCYGVYLELYDSEGNVLAKTTPHTLAIGWISDDFMLDERYDVEQMEVLFLEAYFSEEEIAAYLSWVEGEDHAKEMWRYGCVKYVTGYYDEKNDFIPVEVLFGQVNNDNREFLLENSLAKTEISSKKLVQRKMSYYDKETEETKEQGYIKLYRFTTDTELNKKAERIVQENGMTGKEIISEKLGGGEYVYNKSYMYGSLEGSEAAGYAYAMCVDTDYLILHNSYVVSTIKSIVLFCQLMAFVLMGVYLYIQKKEKKIKDMRDTFLNAIAHEMKTPAAVIQNGVECIQAGIHPEKQEHYLEIIDQEAVHMSELLNSMLIYTRVSDSVYRLNKENYPLDKLAERVCTHYSTLIEQKEITLQWEKHDFYAASYDVRLIEMVLDNFISNAVKFCYQGGTICIHLEKRGVRIFNEGDGISDEHMKYIWDPLYKGDASRTAENGSSGMGLAVSAAILNLHKAEYGTENVPGGVEFYFYLNR